MEFQFASAALTALLVAVVACVWKVANWVWFRPKKLEKILRQQGLKGNLYKPLFGDYREFTEAIKLASSKPIDLDDNIIGRVTPYLQQTIKTHGKSCFLWLGPSPMVLTMDPEVTKEIFSKIYDFHKAGTNPLGDYLLAGLVFHEDEKWAKHRKIINPAFHQEKLKLMIPAFYESCKDLVEEWNKLVPDEGSCELDVRPHLQSLTRDVISRTAFGSSYKEGRRIFELLKQLIDVTLPAVQSLDVSNLLKCVYNFLPTKTNMKLRELYNGIRDSIMMIIKKREGATEVQSHNLLGLLMDSNAREIQENGNKKDLGMSLKDVIDECKIFYLAGQETSSVLLVWTMILLSKNPQWQERARQEVLDAFGDKKPDFNGLNHLKLITNILYEVLRMYPPVPSFTRFVAKTTTVGGLILPKGAMVSMLNISMHYDQTLWGEDALEFNPDRFSHGILNATKTQQTCYFPFGWGPRICIGQNFALMEAKMAMAMILRKYSFQVSPSYLHAPKMDITLHPQHGAPLILRKIC